MNEKVFITIDKHEDMRPLLLLFLLIKLSTVSYAFKPGGNQDSPNQGKHTKPPVQQMALHVLDGSWTGYFEAASDDPKQKETYPVKVKSWHTDDEWEQIVQITWDVSKYDPDQKTTVQLLVYQYIIDQPLLGDKLNVLNLHCFTSKGVEIENFFDEGLAEMNGKKEGTFSLTTSNLYQHFPSVTKKTFILKGDDWTILFYVKFAADNAFVNTGRMVLHRDAGK